MRSRDDNVLEAWTMERLAALAIWRDADAMVGWSIGFNWANLGMVMDSV